MSGCFHTFFSCLSFSFAINHLRWKQNKMNAEEKFSYIRFVSHTPAANVVRWLQ